LPFYFLLLPLKAVPGIAFCLCSKEHSRKFPVLPFYFLLLPLKAVPGIAFCPCPKEHSQKFPVLPFAFLLLPLKGCSWCSANMVLFVIIQMRRQCGPS
jgi:hypothetical protein